MAKKQSRRSVSIDKPRFTRFAAFCAERNIPHAQVIALLIDVYLSNPIDIEIEEPGVVKLENEIAASGEEPTALSHNRYIEAWWEKQKTKRAAQKAKLDEWWAKQKEKRAAGKVVGPNAVRPTK